MKTYHMACQSLVTQKHKSKQIRSKEKCAKSILAKVNVPVHSLKQLVPEEREGSVFKERSALETTGNKNEEGRPIQYQTFLLSNEYTYADFTYGQCKKLNLFSSFCCDKYCEDKELLLEGQCKKM